jgi:phenylalanyl-tRNA synthetase beta subunit
MDWFSRKLGLAVSADQVRDILTRLEFKVTGKAEMLEATPPSGGPPRTSPSRMTSSKRPMIGYGAIEPRAPSLVVCRPNFRAQFRVRFAPDRCPGFTEGQLFLHQRRGRSRWLQPGRSRDVANPIASDQTLMRLSCY